jgi:hypothetical protein
MLKTYPALEKLRFNQQQDLFWVEDAKVFKRIENLPPAVPIHIYRDLATGKDMNQKEYVETMAAALKGGRKFAVSHRIVMADAGDPASSLFGIPAEQIAEYRRIIQSRNDAISKLINHVEGQKVSETGKIIVGKTRLDEKVFALRLVQKHQSMKPVFPVLPNPQATTAEQLQQLKNPKYKPGFQDLIGHVIDQATRENDMEFLRKISRKPTSRKKLENGPDPVQEFLVDFWCGQCNGLIIDRSDLPPLCFFTDEALPPFCAYALGMDSDRIGDVGKQRRRLGLKQPKGRKIRTVILTGDRIQLS